MVDRGDGSGISGLKNISGVLYFSADDGVYGTEIWKSDGTAAGTLLVSDINPYNDGSTTWSHLMNVNGILFFSADDGIHGEEFWRSDGSTNGSVIVADVKPGPESSLHAFYPWDGPDPASENGILFFSADDGIHGMELWKTDGTQLGTTMAANLAPDDGYDPGSYPDNICAVSGTVYFTANDGTHQGLWKTDGGAEDAVFLKELYELRTPVDFNGKLFFVLYGYQLWKSDGTESGTMLVKEFNSVGLYTDLVASNDALYFIADDGSHGPELWKSDGTEAGTVIVKDINPVEDPYIDNLIDVNGTLFFFADDGVHGKELWKSDGIEAGTVLVKDINSGPGSLTDCYGCDEVVNVNGVLFFNADDGINSWALWKTDGTAEGTVMVKDILPYNLTAVGGRLFFAGSDGEHGWELWKSDGTTAGTVMVGDINPGGDSSPYNLTQVGNILFFTANDGQHGEELWAYIVTFSDVPSGYWAASYIDAIYNADITSGCGDGNYCPENPVTRAQMAVFILKALGEPPAGSCSEMFGDVSASTVGDTFCRYIEKFASLGITAGCGEGNYCPDDPVTRAQMAVFITKALNQAAASSCTGNIFGDVNGSMAGGEGFCKYIEKFSTLDITSGCGGGNYCPNDPVTRAQMAVFLTKGFLQ
jgi:ELWxxDGT repeat protein